jgi:hypothetical protein
MCLWQSGSIHWLQMKQGWGKNCHPTWAHRRWSGMQPLWASPCLVDDACAQHIKSPPPFSHTDMNWNNKLLITLFFTETSAVEGRWPRHNPISGIYTGSRLQIKSTEWSTQREGKKGAGGSTSKENNAW